MKKDWTQTILVIAAAASAVLIAVDCLQFIQLKRIGGQFAERRARNKEMARFLDEMRQPEKSVQLIGDDQVSSVIDEIAALGDASKLEFVALESKTVRMRNDERLRALPIEIQLRSGYIGLGEFLGELTGLRNADVYISRFQIERDPAIAPQVRSSVTVEVLLDNGLKE